MRKRMAATSLVSDAFLVFFATLAAFPLAENRQTIMIGGFVLAAVLLLASGATRSTYGVAIGWVAQGVILVAGFAFLPLFFLSPVFLVIHWWLDRVGARIDRDRARLEQDDAVSSAT